MFKKLITVFSLFFSFLSFSSYAVTRDFVEYDLDTIVPVTPMISHLDSKSSSEPSYAIKYSFLEMTTSKVYYI